MFTTERRAYPVKRKIIDYKLIDMIDIENVGPVIMAYIKEGWRPVGSVYVVTPIGKKLTYLQTMVKYEGEGPEVEEGYESTLTHLSEGQIAKGK